MLLVLSTKYNSMSCALAAWGSDQIFFSSEKPTRSVQRLGNIDVGGAVPEIRQDKTKEVYVIRVITLSYMRFT